MALWRLVDGRYPVDDPAEFPTLTLSTEAELRQELERLRHEDPGLFSLTAPTDDALQVGIGGPYAGLRWFENPLASKRSREVLADRQYSRSRVDYLAEGDTIAFWPEHLMPADQAIDVILHFFKHQRLPDWVAWKEWDPANYTWTFKPAASIQSA